MRVVSLFAGIGGLDVGLERLGHEGIYANDIDKYCKIIYDRHFTTRLDCRDIRTVSESDIPDHDILCGGFPCQPFSIAGKHGGFTDTRGTLFFEIARIAGYKRPAYLFLENVKGLLSHDNGRTFETILRTLDELGYDAQWQVCNSKNFGVPQNRERVFIIGHLRGKPGPQVFPLRDNNPAALSELTGSPYQSSRLYDPRGLSVTLASQAGGLGAKTGLYAVRATYQGGKRTIGLQEAQIANTITATTYKGVDANNRNVVIPVLAPDRLEKRQNGRRFKENGDPSFTLTSQDRHGVVVNHGQLVPKQQANTLDANYYKGLDNHQARTGILEGLAIRKLTPLECERLQGFPDGWTEGVSDTQRYKMLGNAVTVNVVYEIARRAFPVSLSSDAVSHDSPSSGLA